MTASPGPTATFVFGEFRLDVGQSRLTRDGTIVALRPKAFDVLAALADRANELVTKDELLDRVWGRRFITEGVIKSIVAELRSALGDDPRQARWIETVPRRGYRFVGAVTVVGPATDARADEPARPALGNLPETPTAPVGRDEALRTVAALNDAHRLVTICGPSGVGKTRLALALAASRRSAWPDGAWFIELAALEPGATDIAALCATVAQAMRLDASAGADLQSLTTALRPLSALIVLDNAEHLLEPVSRLVAAVSDATSALRLVVTSQEPLHTRGEQVYRVAPLSLPEAADDADEDRLMASSAVQLFVQRVCGRLQDFELAPAQQHAVAAICRALDGMPLALELAAARVPLLGVNGIADLLLGDEHDARLRLLTGGARDAAPRQRTLRQAIDWSYRLLDDAQQQTFRRLGVFSNGCAIESARLVCRRDAGDDWVVLDALDALVDKSLLDAIDVGGTRRLRMLESLRAFALERLVDAGEERAARAAHVEAMRTYWSRADDFALVEPALAWTERHRVEVDNLRAALRWAEEQGDGANVVALVAYSASFWCRAGLGNEGHAWCERARAHASAVDDVALRSRLDLAVATLGLYADAYPHAVTRAHAEAAAAALEAAGDGARAYYAIYVVFQSSVRAQLAFDRDALLARMRRLERPEWGDLLRRFARGAHGYALRLAGDTAGYLAFCRAELALCQRIGATSEGWVAAQGLMLAEQDIGHAERAVAIGEEAIDAMRAAGRLRQHPTFLALWTTMLAECGERDRTRAALVELLPILRGSGNPWMAHVALAWFAAHEGRDADATRVLASHEAALASGRVTGSGAYIARSSKTLRERLRAATEPARFARWSEEGAAVDDDEAERVGLRDE